MKPFYLSALCILMSITKPSFSQEVDAGARITSLGNVGVALKDAWNLQSNQSGIAFLTKKTLSIDCRNHYLNREVNTQSMVFAVPFGRNAFGFSVQHYGIAAFSEQKLGLTYAKRFGDILSLAINANYHQIKINQYGSTGAVTAEVGFQYKPDHRLTIGGHIANPFQSRYSTDVAGSLPVKFELGTSYIVSDKVLLNSGVVKDLESKASLRGGIEYIVLSSFALRGGLAMNPFRQYAGFGYKLGSLKLDAAVASQALLGYSPQLGLSYDF